MSNYELKSKMKRMGTSGSQSNQQLQRLANENFRLLADLQEKDKTVAINEDRIRTLETEVHGFQALRNEQLRRQRTLEESNQQLQSQLADNKLRLKEYQLKLKEFDILAHKHTLLISSYQARKDEVITLKDERDEQYKQIEILRENNRLLYNINMQLAQENQRLKDNVYNENINKDAVQQYLRETDYEQMLASSLARQVEKNKI